MKCARENTGFKFRDRLMLQSKLLSLINQEEGAKLEFKQDGMRPETMAKEIVAFANMNGGIILVGVDENDKNISGIQRKNFQEWLMDTVIGRYVHPFILPDYEEITTDEGRVAVVEIPQGNSKPYVLRHNNREDVYVRYGDTCQLATREQSARLYESGGLISIEKMPVHGSRLQDLDKRRLQNYFVEVSQIIELGQWQRFSNEDITEWLINRDLMCDVDDDCVCTIGGLALFGMKPNLRLSQSAIRLTVFPGLDKDYNTDLDIVISSPFVALGRPDDTYYEPPVTERVLSALQPHISKEKLDRTTRRRYWDYQEDVIREVTVNAFAHRDWTRNTDIEISAYTDRMEIISPGALVNGMTVDKLKAGQRTPRNNNIVSVLRDCGLMEHQGMGIRRKVIPLMKKYNDTEPIFEATEDYFKVTLLKKLPN